MKLRTGALLLVVCIGSTGYAAEKPAGRPLLTRLKGLIAARRATPAATPSATPATTLSATRATVDTRPPLAESDRVWLVRAWNGIEAQMATANPATSMQLSISRAILKRSGTDWRASGATHVESEGKTAKASLERATRNLGVVEQAVRENRAAIGMPTLEQIAAKRVELTQMRTAVDDLTTRARRTLND